MLGGYIYTDGYVLVVLLIFCLKWTFIYRTNTYTTYNTNIKLTFTFTLYSLLTLLILTLFIHALVTIHISQNIII